MPQVPMVSQMPELAVPRVTRLGTERWHDVVDPVWARLRNEAEEAAEREPLLAGFFTSAILGQPSLEAVIGERIAARLGDTDLPGSAIRAAWLDAVARDKDISQALRADVMAVVDRDPAADRTLEPVLYFKGFHAIQSHRLAHSLWGNGHKDFALYLQSRASSVFAVDIHPQVPMGRGVFFDHATGIVIGATAVIEDDVSILQGVTLGGTGKESGDRHPKIRRGVLIGAGAKVLGNIEVGRCARVAAGSVVLKPVPRNSTVAGIPAKVVGEAGCAEPARSMDQMFEDNIWSGADI
ncbi:serine O-acetyltransferase [Xanthobacter sp. SG618]|uniref:Serine acetyltransferase n=2 Tax=Xanthobacter TaxID=279 RepID=A0A9W6CJ27_XANFL|nr:serine O-acetyltransferase [Xanthobacter flavus]NMN56994.1 serine O-acetyltransferase [Xanthobacter sp. SG618]GLI23323.1 serine acetyltransferase [Xanthobacter flavus]